MSINQKDQRLLALALKSNKAAQDIVEEIEQGGGGTGGGTGPTGAQGEPGVTGPSGPIGVTGPQGPTGATGADGQDGATGPQGETGPAGADGATGPVGATGADGATGSVPTGDSNTVAGFDGSGDLHTISGYSISDVNGAQVELTVQPNDENGKEVHAVRLNIEPLQDSPNEQWNLINTTLRVDNQSSGFAFGTNGQAAQIFNNYISHQGTGDSGGLTVMNNYFEIGNGTDAINVRGLSISFGFGNINDNVTLSDGGLQGYGFQLHVHENAVIDTYVTSFYDNCDVDCILNSGYTSFSAGPQIEGIANGFGYTGLNLNTQVNEFQGNAGYTGLGVFPTLGSFGTGSFTGLAVNPTITDINYAAGIDVNMDHVTVRPGVAASLVFQDLTFTRTAPDAGSNGLTMQYTGGATAGSEVVSIVGQAITVQIEDGVSTAEQIKDALDENLTFAANITTTISGTDSNPQFVAGPTNFTGGVNPGSKKAANFIGDVSIQGALSFNGALSIGQLSAYHEINPESAPAGTPTTVHGLISSVVAQNGQTVTDADTIGVNTAMLITLEEDSVTSSGAFGLGLSALALPCVVRTEANSSLDYMNCAVYALNLDPSSTGGTIDHVNLCRTVPIPNGVTTINAIIGYMYEEPFGAVSDVTYSFYSDSATAGNYFRGWLKIGGADSRSSDSVGLEVGASDKALLVSRMDSVDEAALTPVDGMIIYNYETGKFRGRAGGVWVDLH